jgi:abortive infection bacteriophage resistance protein
VEDFMNKTAFNKPPLPLDEHLNLLKKRNLIIKNENFAKHKLSIINYYRLSAYFRPFFILVPTLCVGMHTTIEGR